MEPIESLNSRAVEDLEITSLPFRRLVCFHDDVIAELHDDVEASHSLLRDARLPAARGATPTGALEPRSCGHKTANAMEDVVTGQSDRSQPSPDERMKGELFTGAVPTSQVSVRELKAHLSRWLARVQAGELVEVTSHRRAIARIHGLKPPVPAAAHPLQATIDAGLVSWNGSKPVIPTPIVLKGSGKLISEIVLEDRG